MKSAKKYLVVGMGKSGIGAVQALTQLGMDVTAYDQKSEEDMPAELLENFCRWHVKLAFGRTPDSSELKQIDCVVLSPGVSPDLPFISEAAAGGAEVIGELELAYRIGKGTYIAVTGTNGKTTTTTLVGEVFKNAGRNTSVVGNIGVAVTNAALSATDDSWMVTECSSFQLETTKEFHPLVSALLNVTPDHLDRHKTFENYAAAKAMIYKNQTAEDFFVVNMEDEAAWALTPECNATVVPFSRKKELDFGAFVKNAKIVIKNRKGELAQICGTEELIIPGAHNLENALAAAAVCYFAGIGADVIGQTFREFQGVEHRLEFAGEVDGVRFINDSKGTNPDASIKAIEAMKTPTVLIAGGYDKKSDFAEFIQAFGSKVKALVLFGVTAQKLKETAERFGYTNIHMEPDMESCVRKSFELAEAGDTVLLSPACASWDMYTSYEVRGRHFKNCVKELEK